MKLFEAVTGYAVREDKIYLETLPWYSIALNDHPKFKACMKEEIKEEIAAIAKKLQKAMNRKDASGDMPP